MFQERFDSREAFSFSEQDAWEYDMSVRAQRIVKGEGRREEKITAAQIMDPSHPLYASLEKFARGNVSKRQARKFLQKFPQYR